MASSYGLTSTAIELITETYSFAADVSGTVTRETTVDPWLSLGGAPVIQTQVSKAASPTTWVNYAADVTKILAQNFRLRYTSSNGDYFRILRPSMNLKISAVPRNEQKEGTTNGTGATTINLDKIYTYVKNISVEIIDDTNTPLTHVVDNIVLGDPSYFDLYIYNTNTGAQVAKGYKVHFEGI